ncbi:oxygen-dependent choline dehydrogenase 1-like [Oppia nitens]|uniref:oxygen-dependent choline dehydrogenase 1-like n=1 Tax=Oppia nitens TaxID=1686743 RepID=UPI0023DA1332|nr:oxygen-dependent choline dehydrogenase 1-like [Oppia nitens]
MNKKILVIACIVLLAIVVSDVSADGPLTEISCGMECMKYQSCKFSILAKNDCVAPKSSNVLFAALGMATIGIKLIAISIAINARDFKHDSLVSREYWFTAYDYIVVGAGTAGSVLAARLADDITKTVLLLEAGGAQNSSTDIPALRPSLKGTEIDWNHEILPQKYAYFARKESQIPIPAGRVFGGTSTLSHLNYYRESPEYFDLWNTLYDIKNWTFNDVLPYFQKSENNLDSIVVQLRESQHKTGGPITVSTPNSDNILRKYLMAAEKMGYNETLSDGRQPFGATIMQQMVTKDGIALSTSSAYLESKVRPNLNTFGNAFVTKIIFDNKKQVVGIKFQKEGSFWTIKARKEVILCAGAIGSPQLLLLSGIGPKEHLNALQIPLISDLKVGTNVKHSVFVEINYNIKDQKTSEKPLMTTDVEYEYYNEHTGPLGYIASGIHCFKEISYENTNISNGCILPHIDVLDEKMDKVVENFHLRYEWDDYFKPYLGHLVFKLKAVLRRARSSGSLQLESNNAFAKPLIDPRLFSVQSDVDDLVDTLKQAMNVIHSTHFSEYVEPFVVPVPGCQPCFYDKFCDSYLRCIVYTMTDYIQLVGTCRMGIANDTESVVDEKFKVKGVTGLRVIDASILPVPTEQSLAIVVMLAERGAQFIDEEYKNPFKSLWSPPEIKFNLTQFAFPFNLTRYYVPISQYQQIN